MDPDSDQDNSKKRVIVIVDLIIFILTVYLQRMSSSSLILIINPYLVAFLMIIQGFVFEMRSGMNECDHHIFQLCLSRSEKGPKNSGLNCDSNPDLCNAGAVLHRLNYQANWEQVVMLFICKPIDVEIDDDNTRICI